MSAPPVPSPFVGEEVRSLIGRRIETTFTVSDEERHAFERATRLEEVYGDELVGWDLVEGFHLLSLLDPLTHPFLPLDRTKWTGFNYGLDRVRFIRPVRSTDSLRLGADITEVTQKGTGFMIRLDCSIHALGAAEPVLVATAEWLTFVARIPEG